MCQGNGEVILTHPFVLLSHENMQIEGVCVKNVQKFLGVFVHTPEK